MEYILSKLMHRPKSVVIPINNKDNQVYCDHQRVDEEKVNQFFCLFDT